MSYTFNCWHPERGDQQVVADYVRHGFSSAHGPQGDYLVLMLGDDVVAAFPRHAIVTREAAVDDMTDGRGRFVNHVSAVLDLAVNDVRRACGTEATPPSASGRRYGNETLS